MGEDIMVGIVRFGIRQIKHRFEGYHERHGKDFGSVSGGRGPA